MGRSTRGANSNYSGNQHPRRVNQRTLANRKDRPEAQQSCARSAAARNDIYHPGPWSPPPDCHPRWGHGNMRRTSMCVMLVTLPDYERAIKALEEPKVPYHLQSSSRRKEELKVVIKGLSPTADTTHVADYLSAQVCADVCWTYQNIPVGHFPYLPSCPP